MNYSMPGLPVPHQLPEFTQTHVHSVRDAIQPSHPLSSPSPPALNLSQHQVLFKWVSSLHQVAKVLEFQLQHQSFQWTPRISFRMDWLDFLALQGTLQSLLQHHSSKASILRCSAFFIVQLSHPYMTTGKTVGLTAAKSLQLCPTLCDPIDGSLPGSPVPGILQARTLEWVAIKFHIRWNWWTSLISKYLLLFSC